MGNSGQRTVRFWGKTRHPAWVHWGYALCNAGVSLGGIPVNLLLLYYLTEIAGLPAGLAGLALALPKIWDALVDPIFGGWVDQFSVRIGSRVPAILGATALFALTLVLVFSLPTSHSPVALLVIAIALLIVSSVSQTAIGVSQYALATEMTAEFAGLSRLLSIASVVGQTFVITGAVAAPLLVARAGGGHVGYSLMAVEIAAVSALALVLFALSARRVPVRARTADSGTLSVWAALWATRKNRAFYRLMGFIVCQNASLMIIFAILPFANHYVLTRHASGLSVLEGVMGGSVLIGMLIAPLFLRRFSPVRAMELNNIAIAVLLVCLYAASFSSIEFTWLALGAVGLSLGVIGVLVQAAVLATTRIRVRGAAIVAIGFYLGIMVAGIKLGNSAGGFVSGELLSVIGFVPKSAAQAAGTLAGLRAGYTLVPCALIVLGGLFLHFVTIPPDEELIPTSGEAAHSPPPPHAQAAESP